MQKRFSPIKTAFDLVAIASFLEIMFALVTVNIWPVGFWQRRNENFDYVLLLCLFQGLFSIIWMTIRAIQSKDAINEFTNKKFPIMNTIATDPLLKPLVQIILVAAGLSIIGILRALLRLIVEGRVTSW